MITWGELKNLLLKTLDEAGIGDADSRIAEINGALRLFANHTAATATYDAIVRESDRQVSIPDDFLQMRGVFVPDGGYYLECLPAVPGKGYAGKGWYEWPAGVLNLVNYTGRIRITYYAYYKDIHGSDDESQVIALPRWAMYPIVILAAYYCMVPRSVTASELGQWDSTIDSGNPEHNPLMKQALFFWERYAHEVNQWPRQQRELAFYPGVV